MESRTAVETFDRKWKDILKEISKIEARNEDFLLIGDLNKRIDFEDSGKKDSHGGKLVRELLNNGEYILVNKTSKTVGGPYTRYTPEDPNDNNRKSMLDLVIASKNLSKYITKLEIDKDLKWTPFRTVNKNKIRFTDHYALMVIFKTIQVDIDIWSSF